MQVPRLGIEPGPVEWKPHTLSTRPCSRKPFGGGLLETIRLFKHSAYWEPKRLGSGGQRVKDVSQSSTTFPRENIRELPVCQAAYASNTRNEINIFPHFSVHRGTKFLKGREGADVRRRVAAKSISVTAGRSAPGGRHTCAIHM